MIIFDLDGTLADCEHRRHFIDPDKNLVAIGGIGECDIRPGWKPNWKSFFEACDQDELILPTHRVFQHLVQELPLYHSKKIEIWSARCQSVEEKTRDWLSKYRLNWVNLKMRPIGDYTPDDQLKERWLDEAIKEGKQVDYVFDDRPKVVRMWRRRGIFVFDVNQSEKEF